MGIVGLQKTYLQKMYTSKFKVWQVISDINFPLVGILAMSYFLHMPSNRSHNFFTCGVIPSLTTLCTKMSLSNIGHLPIFSDVGGILIALLTPFMF